MSQTLSATLESPRPTRRVNQLPVPLAVAAIVLALAHVPLLLAHMHFLRLKPHYEFTPLVFVGAIVLTFRWNVWGLIRAGHRPGPTERLIGLGLLGLNWIMLTAAVVLDSPWLGMVSFWELLVAVALLAGGWQVVRAAIPALIFLLLLVPPPMNLDGKLVLGLQNVTSRISSKTLDRMGVFHFRDGNAFEIGGKSFFVDKACSGINSLYSVLAVTLFCVLFFESHWLRLGFWLRVFLLLLAVVFWVVVANVTRVTSIVWLDSRFAIDLSKEEFAWAKGLTVMDWNVGNYIIGPHAILGFVLFGLVLALMYSTNQLLKFIGTAVRWGETAPVEPDEPMPAADGFLTRRMSWSLVAPALAAYGVLLVFQLGELRLGAAVTESSLVKYYNNWTVDDLPRNIGGWERQKDNSFESRDRDNPFGAHSRTWQYRAKNGLQAVVSFDYPFPEWHDLRMCYQSIGWNMLGSAFFEAKDASVKLDCVKFDLSKSFELRAYGWFTEFDQNGKPIMVHVPDLTRTYSDVRWSERFSAIRDRWLSVFGKAKAPPNFMDVLQVQVLVEHPGPLAPAVQDTIQQFFLQAAELIRQRCVKGLPGPAVASNPNPSSAN